MEKAMEEENKPKKNKLIPANPDWLDLPDPLVTNVILEHVEIVDYVRFPAVCKKWQSIQKEHRISYLPYSPPLPPPFPWLGCKHCIYKGNGERSFFFNLLDRQKSYNIPFGWASETVFDLGYGNGWFLFMFSSDAMYIFNPITGVQIKLPSASHLDEFVAFVRCTLHISSSPADPDCTILIDDDDDGRFVLCRLNDKGGWKMIEYCSRGGYLGKTVFCQNKIYRVARNRSVVMVDTLLPDPIVQLIKMDWSEICATLLHKRFDLVDVLGELVMVFTVFDDHDSIEEFYVYRADFSTNKWARTDTIGDGAMFYSLNGVLALRADGVAFRKNTIYSVEGYMDCGVSWRAFDVSARHWTDGPPLSIRSSEYHSKSGWFWFLPTLDYCQELCYPHSRAHNTLDLSAPEYTEPSGSHDICANQPVSPARPRVMANYRYCQNDAF